MDGDQLRKLVGEILLKLLPTLAALAVIVPTGDSEPLVRVYFALIAGFAGSTWLSSWIVERKQDRLLKAAEGLREFTIEVVSAADVERVVKELYATPKATFWATHVNYSDEDPPKEDWAHRLYTSGSAKVPFHRIVSVASDRDRAWIDEMVGASVNPDYDLRIVEEQPDQLRYPNVLIVDAGGRLTSFVSFRGLTPDGSGRFAFVTRSETFCMGLLGHLKKYHASLPRAPGLNNFQGRPKTPPSIPSSPEDTK